MCLGQRCFRFCWLLHSLSHATNCMVMGLCAIQTKLADNTKKYAYNAWQLAQKAHIPITVKLVAWSIELVPHKVTSVECLQQWEGQRRHTNLGLSGEASLWLTVHVFAREMTMAFNTNYGLTNCIGTIYIIRCKQDLTNWPAFCRDTNVQHLEQFSCRRLWSQSFSFTAQRKLFYSLQ